MGWAHKFLAGLGPNTQPPPEGSPPPPSARLLCGLAGVVLAAALATLDEELSSAAATDLRGGFGYGPDEGSWISSAYALGNIAIVPLTPWLGQVLSIRRVASLMLIGAAVASVCCPVAPTYFWVMACRLLQGLFEGALLPMLLISLLRFVPPYRKSIALVVYGLVVAAVPLMAIKLEGLITDLFTWRAIFWVTPVLAPIGVFLILFGLKEEEYNWNAFRETDYFGLFSLVVGTGAISVMLGQGQRLDWFDSGLIDALAVCAVFFIGAFLVNEAVTAKPLFKESLFKNRNLVLGLLLITVFTIAVLGTEFLWPQEQIAIRHLRDIQAGNTTLKLVVPLLVMAPITVLALRFLDVRLVLGLGVGLCAMGNWLCVWLTPVWFEGDFMPFLLMQAFSWLLILPSNSMVTTGALKQPDLLTGSAFFNIFRVLGTAFGTALMQALVVVRERVHSGDDIASHIVPGRYPTIQRLLTDGPVRIEQSERAQATVMAFADAYGWLGIILLAAMLLIVLQGPTVIIRPPEGKRW